MAKEAKEMKFGIEDLADKLNIEPASVRIKLRNAGIKKAATGRYGWETKDDLAAVAEKLKATKAAPAKKDDKKSAKADTKSAKGDGAKAGKTAGKAKDGAKKAA